MFLSDIAEVTVFSEINCKETRIGENASLCTRVVVSLEKHDINVLKKPNNKSIKKPGEILEKYAENSMENPDRNLIEKSSKSMVNLENSLEFGCFA